MRDLEHSILFEVSIEIFNIVEYVFWEPQDFLSFLSVFYSIVLFFFVSFCFTHLTYGVVFFFFSICYPIEQGNCNSQTTLCSKGETLTLHLQYSFQPYQHIHMQNIQDFLCWCTCMCHIHIPHLYVCIIDVECSTFFLFSYRSSWPYPYVNILFLLIFQFISGCQNQILCQNC